MDLLLAFIIAMVVTMTLIPPLMRVAGALHVLDEPGERKQHTGAVPCVGGLAMGVGAFLPLLLWLPMDRLLVAYLVAAVLMIGLGVWDDRVSLSPGVKFAGQLIAVLIVVFAGGVTIGSVTLTERITIPDFVALPLSIFFLLGVTNAINLADGLDGLAGGTTLLACCALAALGLAIGVPFVTTVALVVVGSILGFLRFNTYPARVFMGDGGSQFLGFTAGVLAIVLTQYEGAPLSAALPLLILGLPILDTLTVMLMRIRRGQSPFKADRTHIHHKLLALGFDHLEAVVVIYCLQACLFIAAWFLRFESDLLILAAFAVFAAFMLGALIVAERSGWRRREVDRPHEPSTLARLRKWLGAYERLPRWALWTASTCVAAYALGVAFFAQPLPSDVGWLAIGLVIVLAPAVAARAPTPRLEWVGQGALYVAVVVAVYLDHLSTVYFPAFHAVKWLVFPGVITAVVVKMRLSRKRRFQVTTLDALLIILALTIPNLPGLPNASTTLGFSIAKLVALFYAVEMIASHSARARRLAWAGALLFCAGVAAHTFSG